MISGVRAFGCSGIHGQNGTQARPEPGAEIFALIPGDTSSPTFVGFFGGLGAPSSPIVVGQYNERTHRTNHSGANLGHLINVKFTGTSSAEVSGVPLTSTGHTLATIPQISGTLLCRFREPNDSAVTTSNGFFYAVKLNSNSGVPDISDDPADIIIKAAQLADTAGNAGDSSWTTIADGTDSGSNSLGLADQSVSATIHDWHIIISASPQAAGTLRWGFALVVEYT